MKYKINKEQAKSELEEAIPSFDLVGKTKIRESDADITARLIMFHLHALENNLKHRERVRRTYLNDVRNSETLPKTVAETIHGYLNNQIGINEAKESIQNASAKYTEVLQDQGVDTRDYNF